MSKAWFEIDRRGLAEIAKRRGMAFIVTEPVQNSWDEESTLIQFQLDPVEGKPRARLTVRDDSPDGFRDLADSYRMFRTSYKLKNPEQRGRFNLGEKLLLAVAHRARIVTTTGSVIFSEKGRTTGRTKTDVGSVLQAELRMTRNEIKEALDFALTMIPPPGKRTVINGKTLPSRTYLAQDEHRLETEIEGENGAFSYSRRLTQVRTYKPLEGETPHLYEMGIPVDEIDCAWHVEVMQKVPLSIDRSSVRFGYLDRAARIATEIMAKEKMLTEDDARAPFAAKALEYMEDDDAVREVIVRRFGQNAVVFDPSAPESNKLALDAGFEVVHSGSLSRTAWTAVRRAEALKPAGRVFDDGTLSVGMSGEPPITRADWTEQMEALVRYCAAFGEHVCAHTLAVSFYDVRSNDFAAACGHGELLLNVASSQIKSGLEAVDSWKSDRYEQIDQLLIHEYAHVKVDDHLTHDFHRECCRIGARLRSFDERV